jgi:DNA-binding transcriptional ArsR family regulator
VGELAEACEVQSHIASGHLRLMKHCGLLEPERDARKTYYRIAEPQLAGIMKGIRSRFGD